MAELYQSTTHLEPGEIVITEGGSTIAKADIANPGRILGVVSTDPGIILGLSPDEFIAGDKYPVALSGRIPVKINLEGGAIAIGDELSLSSTPGVAKKAQDGEQAIGYALENYAAETASSTIQFFITHGATSGLTLAGLTDALESPTAPAEESLAGRFIRGADLACL